MITTKVKELEAARAKLAALEQQAQAELKAELASLPGKYGFRTMADFVRALRGGRTASDSGKKRFRAVITPEIKAKVRAFASDGKTGAEIAQALGISVPSVQNIKKELGLTRPRK